MLSLARPVPADPLPASSPFHTKPRGVGGLPSASRASTGTTSIPIRTHGDRDRTLCHQHPSPRQFLDTRRRNSMSFAPPAVVDRKSAALAVARDPGCFLVIHLFHPKPRCSYRRDLRTPQIYSGSNRQNKESVGNGPHTPLCSDQFVRMASPAARRASDTSLASQLLIECSTIGSLASSGRPSIAGFDVSGF